MAPFKLTLPAGNSRLRVRGLRASISRSMMRLKPIAAVRAPTIAATIHAKNARVGQSRAPGDEHGSEGEGQRENRVRKT